MAPLTGGIPWKKLSSTAFAVPEDQVLANDGDNELPPVSGKPRFGRIGDSIATFSWLLWIEGAWLLLLLLLLPLDGLLSSQIAGSDGEGVGVEGDSMLVGSCCCWCWCW